MKQFFILILLFSMSKSCGQSAEQQQELRAITYSAMTRGSSYSCTIDKKQIHISSKGTKVENKTRTISQNEWEDVNYLLEKIVLDEIHNLKPPTNKSASDRSRRTTLLIETTVAKHESSSFDENNPPVALKSLIDLILALAETVE